MADITKCTGVRGDIRCAHTVDCYRFTAESGMRQAFFMEAPFQLRYPQTGAVTFECIERIPLDKGDGAK